MQDEHEETETETSSTLDNSLEDLRHLAGGMAAKLFGTKAVSRLDIDPDKTVLSPEADRAIEDIGASIGRFLHAAGEEITRAASPQPSEQDTEPAKDETPSETHEDPAEASLDDEEGWSPLVIGARSLAKSLSAVAGDVFERISPPNTPSGEE